MQVSKLEELTMNEIESVSGGSPDSFNALGAAIANYIRNGLGGSSTGALNWDAVNWQMA